MNKANPLTKLEEEILLRSIKQAALQSCAENMQKYVDCAKGKTFSNPILCRTQFKDLNTCLQQFTTDEKCDVMRREFIEKKYADATI